MKDVLDQYETVTHISDSQLRFLIGVTEFYRARTDTKMTIAAELVRAAVEADGFTFIVAHGISANRYRRADLQDTMQQLSYRPVDDAWSF